MDITVWINIVAILVSPLVAVLVTRWLDNRRQRIANKEKLFWELFSRRHQPVSADTVRAMNLIDVFYQRDRRVRKLWSELFDMYGNEGLNNELGFKQRETKSKELLVEMAKACGYGDVITHLDTERVYTPKGLADEADRNFATQSALISLLQNPAVQELVASGYASSNKEADHAKQPEANSAIEPKTELIPQGSDKSK